MKKWISLLIILATSLSMAKEKPGFTGCGDYVLKGKLVNNIYVINPTAKTEMTFTFTPQDLTLMSSYLDVPTTLKVKILKKMEGNRGEISEVNGVSIRKPNLKDPYTDSGIFFQSARYCQ